MAKKVLFVSDHDGHNVDPGLFQWHHNLFETHIKNWEHFTVVKGKMSNDTRERLNQKISKAKYVLVAGASSLKAVLDRKGIVKCRGQAEEIDGRTFYCCYSLAHVNQVPRYKGLLEADIINFGKILHQGGITQKDINYTIVTARNMKEAIADIRATRILGFDTETSGLNPWAPGFWVTSLGISTAENNWTFPLNHRLSPVYQDKQAQQLIVDEVDDAILDSFLVTHNGKFDTKVMYGAFGKMWHTSFDTMIAHYNYDENSAHSLEILALMFLNVPTYDIPLSDKQGLTGTLEKHCKYLGLDINCTRRLYFKFKKLLMQDPDAWRVFWHLSMPAARQFAAAECEGFYINPDRLEKAKQKWTRKRNMYRRWLDKRCPSTLKWKNRKTGEWETGINWNSSVQCAEVLFGEYEDDNRYQLEEQAYQGLTSIEVTDKGADSTSESVLQRLKHPVADRILKFRLADKYLSTYILPWQGKMFDGRIHGTFNIDGTVTGRTSCKDPNWQQVPRNPEIRSLIEAPPGWRLVDADYSQIELRIAAEVSGDNALTHAYSTGMDIHTLTVQTIIGLANPDKEQRKMGKAINFGFIYGMWWKKFMTYARDNFQVEFTEKESQEAREGFLNLYNGIPQWHKRQKRFVHSEGYVANLIGRKRRLPAALRNDGSRECKEAERKAINSPVQSMASDLIMLSLIELGEKLSSKDYRFLGVVHDSILMLVREKALKRVLPVIYHTMLKPKQLLETFNYEFSIPIDVEIETGPWGKGTVWEPTKT